MRLAPIITLALAGCSTARYQRALSSTHTVSSDAGDKSRSGSFSMQRNTIELSDETGVLCAAISTAGSAKAARDKAIEQGASEYKYKVTAATQYQGFTCGGYWSWAGGDSLQISDGDGPGGIIETGQPGYAIFGEGGFRFGARGSSATGLSYGAHLDLGYGGWRIDGLETEAFTGANGESTGLKRLNETTNYVRLLSSLDLSYTPAWSYGVGLFGHASWDILLASKLNYGAGGSYIVALGKRLFFDAAVFWQRTHTGKSDTFLVDSREVIARTMVRYAF